MTQIFFAFFKALTQESRVSQLERELDQMRAAFEEAKTNVTSLESRLTNESEQLAKLTSARDEALKLREKADVELERLRREKDETDHKAERLKKELQATVDENEMLRKDKETAEMSRDEAQGMMMKKSAEVERLSKEASDHEVQYSECFLSKGHFFVADGYRVA